MFAHKNCLLVPADAHSAQASEPQTIYTTPSTVFLPNLNSINNINNINNSDNTDNFHNNANDSDNCSLDSLDSDDAALLAVSTQGRKPRVLDVADQATDAANTAALAQAAALLARVQHRHASASASLPEGLQTQNDVSDTISDTISNPDKHAERNRKRRERRAQDQNPQDPQLVFRKRGRPRLLIPDDVRKTMPEINRVHNTRDRPGRPRLLRHEDIPADDPDLAGLRKPGRKKIDLTKRDLFRFFCRWRRLEHSTHIQKTSSAKYNPALLTDTLVSEFLHHTHSIKYQYTHMFELWDVYQRQQIPLLPPVKTPRDARKRRKLMFHNFFLLKASAHKQLVDDWLVERTARQRQRHAEALETCLARRVLTQVKADLLVLVSNIEYVLRDSIEPQSWPSPFDTV